MKITGKENQTKTTIEKKQRKREGTNRNERSNGKKWKIRTKREKNKKKANKTLKNKEKKKQVGLNKKVWARKKGNL